MTGGAGADTFFLFTRAETRSASFTAADTTTANIDRILDFHGVGAGGTDSLLLGIAADAFGAGLTFTAATTTVVTAVTIIRAADFTELAEAVDDATPRATSSATTAQITDVTVLAGSLMGRYMIVNDASALIQVTDAIVSMTGITGALAASDFFYG